MVNSSVLAILLEGCYWHWMKGLFRNQNKQENCFSWKWPRSKRPVPIGKRVSNFPALSDFQTLHIWAPRTSRGAFLLALLTPLSESSNPRTAEAPAGENFEKPEIVFRSISCFFVLESDAVRVFLIARGDSSTWRPRRPPPTPTPQTRADLTTQIGSDLKVSWKIGMQRSKVPSP